ncbi:MAG: hypothetical protein M0036_22685 [Desulfobacteraceae bacterium]|nr:hypothetical protein [Desulfobacteraceae bacterium]
MTDEDKTPESDKEWDNRVLCSDGNCIGTVGPDGRCKECGMIYTGDQPLPKGEGNDDLFSLDEEPDSSQPENKDASADVSDDEWSQRKLCPDENCIGVIGPDGRCKECGKPG